MDNNIPPSDDDNKNDGLDLSDDIVQSEDDGGGDEIIDTSDLYNTQPKTGGKGNVLLAVAGVLLIGGYVLYSIFSEEKKNKDVDPLSGQKGDAKAVGYRDVPGGVGELPQPPTIALQPPPDPVGAPVFVPPPIVSPSAIGSPPSITPSVPVSIIAEAPPPPPPPVSAFKAPPVPPVPKVSEVTLGKVSAKAVDKNMQKRINSRMLIRNGGNKAASSSSSSSTLSIGDPNSSFYNNTIKATKAETELATSLTNLNMTIAQGKIVNAVLETAINTDLPGTIRAIVSRDTYAEAGRTVLIPKGSRLIGTYNTGILRGQKRVMIVWTRLIRPDGIDIQIGSPGVDGLGRGGVEGHVDNKYTEIFSAAILTTMITIGAAVAVEAVLPDDGVTTTNTDGSTSSTNSSAKNAASQGVGHLSSTARDIVTRMIDIRPTITVDQGTRVNVFVNKDLVFPGSFAGGVFIQ
ncbi:MAG: TrbI/VirB10 family protein [Rickettsiales bacterium]